MLVENIVEGFICFFRRPADLRPTITVVDRRWASPAAGFGPARGGEDPSSPGPTRATTGSSRTQDHFRVLPTSTPPDHHRHSLYSRVPGVRIWSTAATVRVTHSWRWRWRWRCRWRCRWRWPRRRPETTAARRDYLVPGEREARCEAISRPRPRPRSRSRTQTRTRVAWK